jgi:hypothetical protein
LDAELMIKPGKRNFKGRAQNSIQRSSIRLLAAEPSRLLKKDRVWP